MREMLSQCRRICAHTQWSGNMEDGPLQSRAPLPHEWIRTETKPACKGLAGHTTMASQCVFAWELMCLSVGLDPLVCVCVCEVCVYTFRRSITGKCLQMITTPPRHSLLLTPLQSMGALVSVSLQFVCKPCGRTFKRVCSCKVGIKNKELPVPLNCGIQRIHISCSLESSVLTFLFKEPCGHWTPKHSRPCGPFF